MNNNNFPKSGLIIIKKIHLMYYLNQSSLTNFDTSKEEAINKNKKIKYQPYFKGNYRRKDSIYENIAKRKCNSFFSKIINAK